MYHIPTKELEIEQHQKWQYFSKIYQNINQKQLNYLVICIRLMMLFFPSDRKVTNQNLVEKTWKDLQLLRDFSHQRSWSTRYFSMRMRKGHNSLFLEGWSVIAKLLKSSSYFNFVNIVKWHQNGVEGKKVLMRILVGQRTRQDHNLTIYDETKFSSCHTPYINSILYPASSYYFLLFQTGNLNVNVRPDLLYFSIWGVSSKTYQKT